jgi:hypothetical protein
MGLWLKDETKKHGTYSVAQYNTIPTGVQGVAIVSAILATSLCMIYPLWSILSIVCSILLFSNVVLLVYHVPKDLHCMINLKSRPLPVLSANSATIVVAYYFLGLTSAVTPILFPWVNVIMKDDAEARAFTTGAMVSL